LSTSSEEEILHIAFAVLEDDTGNHCLQGFIKTNVRHRADKLTKALGCAFFSVVSTSGAVADLLMETQSNDEVFEFGNSTSCDRAGCRNDIAIETLSGLWCVLI